MTTKTKNYPPINVAAAEDRIHDLDDGPGYGRSVYLRGVTLADLVAMFGDYDEWLIGDRQQRYTCWWSLYDKASDCRFAIRSIAKLHSLPHVTTWDVWVEDTAVYDTLVAVFGAERICD